MKINNERHTDQPFLLAFDPIVLVRDVVRHWLVILLTALMVGVGTYIVTDAFYSPVYRTTTTFVATDRSSSSTVYSNLTTTTSLAGVFSDLLNSSILRKAILEEIGQTSFNGTITAAVIPETNLLTVTVSDSSPRTAFLVAQAIIDHHETVTYQVVDGVALEVLQYPTVPAVPSNRTNVTELMKKLMLATAAATCVLILFLSYRRDTVRSGTEARMKLDCNYLGEIPHEEKYKTLISKLRRRKTSILISSPLTSFHFAETIRKLRHRVEQHMRGGKVLMVTSLLENEGKSTVAVNLALAMAQKYNKVLLIDCDLRKPACYMLLEQHAITSGLKDVLTGSAKLSDVLIRHKSNNLFLLLEKKGVRNSGDLIASENMKALIAWARREFDFVVLDLPPMSAASDAESVMEFADSSVLVVRQNAAPTPAINKAVATLKSGKARLMGCVLNNVYTTSLTSISGYGYGGYGKYGKYGQYKHYGTQHSGNREG